MRMPDTQHGWGGGHRGIIINWRDQPYVASWMTYGQNSFMFYAVLREPGTSNLVSYIFKRTPLLKPRISLFFSSHIYVLQQRRHPHHHYPLRPSSATSVSSSVGFGFGVGLSFFAAPAIV
jgi:hypothetical protein